jgi:hypothetical protein
VVKKEVEFLAQQGLFNVRLKASTVEMIENPVQHSVEKNFNPTVRRDTLSQYSSARRLFAQRHKRPGKLLGQWASRRSSGHDAWHVLSRPYHSGGSTSLLAPPAS